MRGTAVMDSTRGVWTRPIVVLNVIALIGILVSLLLVFAGDTLGAYFLLLCSNAPAEIYLTILARHLP